jgi:ferredoxin
MNCPSCHRLLYSRQHKKCGFCGAVLPSEVRFSDDEIATIKAEQAAIAMRRAKAKEQEEKEQEEEKRRRGAGDGGFHSSSMF